MTSTTTVLIWTELSDHVQTDLLEWLNITPPDDDDRTRLCLLYNDGRFHAWNCPTCGARVQSADPTGEEWQHFQGTRQPDFSYYGDATFYTAEVIEHQCDTCRCWMPKPDHRQDGDEY